MNIEEKYNRLLELFEDISKIPRDSKKEKEIALFVCDFAKKLGLEYKMDDYFNVIVKRSADSGMEDKKKIIFQAHLDMVCEKTLDSKHNFDTDPIEIIKGSNVYSAKDTTLGADDGIGVSTLLLLMESNDIKLPCSYFIFTTQEEIGMDGAKNIDLSYIDADYLINLDSEEENSVIVGCAGGLTLAFKRNDNLFDISDSVYELSISGLKGGHSGVDIDKNRMNANYLGSLILSKLSNVHLISFNGGSKTNAIPNESSIVFSAKTLNIEDDINKIISEIDFLSETDVQINVKTMSGEFKGISEMASKEILSLILGLKQNVITRDDIVKSSGNVGIVNLVNGETEIYESMRSNISDELNNYKNINIDFADSLGFVVSISEEYPGWDKDAKSKLLDLYVKSYQKIHDNQKPIICEIHAGLECGVLKEKLLNIDAISIGPDLKDVHTVNEKLYLDSCKKLLSSLFELLNNL